MKNILNRIFRNNNKVDIIELHQKLLKVAKKYYNEDYCCMKIEYGGSIKFREVLYSTYINNSTWYEGKTFEESLNKHIK